MTIAVVVVVSIVSEHARVTSESVNLIGRSRAVYAVMATEDGTCRIYLYTTGAGEHFWTIFEVG